MYFSQTQYRIIILCQHASSLLVIILYYIWLWMLPLCQTRSWTGLGWKILSFNFASSFTVPVFCFYVAICTNLNTLAQSIFNCWCLVICTSPSLLLPVTLTTSKPRHHGELYHEHWRASTTVALRPYYITTLVSWTPVSFFQPISDGGGDNSYCPRRPMW